MSMSLRKNTGARFSPIPATIRAAASGMLAEAAAARGGLADAASQIADDARVGAKSLQVHARRAALVGASAANDAIESGMQVGAQAWREARRQAAEWGSSAIAQARSRPAAVVAGVAIVGVAVGFWLRGNLRREPMVTRKPRKARAKA